MTRRLPVLLVLGLLAPGAAPATSAAAAKPAKAPRARLAAFGSCTALVRYARANAARTGGGVGVPPRVMAGAPTVLSRPQPVREVQTPAMAAPDASSGAGTGAGDAFSTTNVQEAGIDEPDVVKTDGRRIVAVSDGRLRVVDVSDPAAPRLAGSLALEEGYQHQLLLRDDRVLV